MRKNKKTAIEHQGQVGNQTLFWVVFGVLAVGLVLLLSGSVYSPQVQPQAQQAADPSNPFYTQNYYTFNPPAISPPTSPAIPYFPSQVVEPTGSPLPLEFFDGEIDC